MLLEILFFPTREQIHFHLVTVQQFKSWRGTASPGLRVQRPEREGCFGSRREPPCSQDQELLPRHPGFVRFATTSLCVFLPRTHQHISCPDSTQCQLEHTHLPFKKSCVLPLIPETPLTASKTVALDRGPPDMASSHKSCCQQTATGSQMQGAPEELQKGDPDVGLLMRTARNGPEYSNRRALSLEQLTGEGEATTSMTH